MGQIHKAACTYILNFKFLTYFFYNSTCDFSHNNQMLDLILSIFFNLHYSKSMILKEVTAAHQGVAELVCL